MVAGSRLQRLNDAVRKRSAGAQILLSEHVQALWHSYRPLTRPDRGLLDRCNAVPDHLHQHMEPYVQCCTYLGQHSSLTWAKFLLQGLMASMNRCHFPSELSMQVSVQV